MPLRPTRCKLGQWGVQRLPNYNSLAAGTRVVTGYSLASSLHSRLYVAALQSPTCSILCPKGNHVRHRPSSLVRHFQVRNIPKPYKDFGSGTSPEKNHPYNSHSPHFHSRNRDVSSWSYPDYAPWRITRSLIKSPIVKELPEQHYVLLKPWLNLRDQFPHGHEKTRCVGRDILPCSSAIRAVTIHSELRPSEPHAVTLRPGRTSPTSVAQLFRASSALMPRPQARGSRNVSSVYVQPYASDRSGFRFRQQRIRPIAPPCCP